MDSTQLEQSPYSPSKQPRSASTPKRDTTPRTEFDLDVTAATQNLAHELGVSVESVFADSGIVMKHLALKLNSLDSNTTAMQITTTKLVAKLVPSLLI